MHYDRKQNTKKILPLGVNYSRILVFHGGLGKELARRGKNDFLPSYIVKTENL
jgi:hypothetical protein